MKTRTQDNFSTRCLYRNLIAEGQKRDAASNFTTQAQHAEVKVEAMASQRLNAHFSPTTSATQHTHKHAHIHVCTSMLHLCIYASVCVCMCKKNRSTNMFPLARWKEKAKASHLLEPQPPPQTFGFNLLSISYRN